jgi:hypothetical protein
MLTHRLRNFIIPYASQILSGVILVFNSEVRKHFACHSLAERPDAIASIPIKITVAGINPLLQSPSVKAIIENQAILPCETPQKRDFSQDESLR